MRPDRIPATRVHRRRRCAAVVAITGRRQDKFEIGAQHWLLEALRE